jgi:formylglycine-generating enzyme required for sulfatase activity
MMSERVSIGVEGNGLHPFNFIVATILTRPEKLKQEWIIQQQQHSAYKFLDSLSDDVHLEMVAIPSGSFLMGSSLRESERCDYEIPQHDVNVPLFFIGRYPITQVQWKAVAAMPKVECELIPDCATFKGDNRPADCISWYSAVEFCTRLTKHTNRQYRLPSEAEWEYACRAGTTTPFHFGETITTDLANYQGTDWEFGGTIYPGFYGFGPRGEYRRETTPVDHFGVANAFGLCDMHGNVWEWCQDHFHENYEGAPTDGSAWFADDRAENDYMFRGGSWNSVPWDCRSAYRNWDVPGDNDFFNVGFRVCCSQP